MVPQFAANPELTVEYRGRAVPGPGHHLPNGPERDRLFARMSEVIPGAYGYQDRCRDHRQIPVVSAERVPRLSRTELAGASSGLGEPPGVSP